MTRIHPQGIEMSISAKYDGEVSVSDSPTRATSASKHVRREANCARGEKNGRPRKIWIDLENSPHIPFFKPIIDELEYRGYRVVLTARDCFQVRDLADLFGLRYRLIGRHYGKHTLAKLAGLGIRVLQLAPYALREKPDLALSHGSRSLFVLCSILGIPTVSITDYEHTRWIGAGQRTWIMAPEVLPADALHAMGYKNDRILRYPGIKEDVYVPAFRPDASIRQRLALGNQDLVVTLRPPATEAHYHNPESDKLLNAVFETISRSLTAKVVLLPRTPHQEAELRKQWPELFRTGKAVVPEHVVNGLDLIWFSDLVISGGGTMNREAAALGVPVYSIFRGKTGAVDEYLAKTGRLVMLQSAADVSDKLKLVRRNIDGHPPTSGRHTLQTIVDHVSRVVGSEAC
jgi:uncharacterized protein